MNKINLAEKLSLFEGHWQPRVVGAFNGHDLMVVKFQGQFPWHSHADTDDFFLVLKVEMIMRLRDGDIRVGAGQVFVVPKGVEHAPFAEEETHVLLIEPKGTPNTGDPATAAPRREI